VDSTSRITRTALCVAQAMRAVSSRGRRTSPTAFPAVLRLRRTIGVQFHPEKSSTAGLRFIAGALAEITA
jgi:imidazoleglycerol phosphate synthase glutamine amidotransferase subunit HisH